MTESHSPSGFDRGAAVTRSMLGWGVVAGPFYLVFGLILALTRPGFDLTRDALSLLLLGDLGWLQALNLVLSGLMTITAAIGLLRTPGWSRTAATLVGVYGLFLVLSALFVPDATGDFPPTSGGGQFTVHGMLHLVFGGLGFLSVGVAAVIAAAWLRRHTPRGAVLSIVAGILIVAAFVAGGALATSPIGVGLIWIAVLATWAWLAVVSIVAYRAVPHPVIAQRVGVAHLA